MNEPNETPPATPKLHPSQPTKSLLAVKLSKKRSILSALLVALAFVVVGVAWLLFANAADGAPSGPLSLYDAKWCLHLKDGVARSGATVYLYTCNNTSAQRWDLFSDSTIRIHSNTSYCLDVKDGSTIRGGVAWLWKCDGTPAQVWKARLNADNTTSSLVNPQSNKCLDNKSGIQQNGNKIQIWDCASIHSQKWTLPKNSNPTPAPSASSAPTPTPTPVPTPTGSPSGSGEAMPLGNLPGWQQVFTDDFTQNVPLGKFPSAVAAKWDAYPYDWPDTSKNGRYYPEKVVSIDNGLMNLYLHTENNIHMVAAPFPKIPGATGSGGGMQYGRYAIRFKSDPVPNYKTAWLLWPDSEVWPRDGEIDFPEGDLDSTIGAFMHRQNGTSGSDQDAYETTSRYTSWHTAVIEWRPESLKFILDGKTIGTSTSRIPNTPMHWVIQTETALDTAPSNSAAGNLQIDWVAVYKYVP